jgi:Ca2+-binding EF-hand superfamily protein
MCYRKQFFTVLILAAPVLMAEHNRPRNMRFRNMDANGDGVIKGSEWRGNIRAFNRHDWNGDGVLSGDELIPGARPPGRASAAGTGRENAFNRLDTNRNGVIDVAEWRYHPDAFTALDLNRDQVLGFAEFIDLMHMDLEDLDRNRDGRISAREWPGGAQWFAEVDQNRNGVLSAAEYLGRGSESAQEQRFRAWDLNRDGLLQGPEWRSDNRLFHVLDRDMDSKISLEEFMSQDRMVFLRDLDRNNDGFLELREWNGAADEFRNLDVNADNRLDSTEYFYRGTQQDRRERFGRVDLNRDGVIEGNEWHDAPALFHQLDADHNGVLALVEFLSNPVT